MARPLQQAADLHVSSPSETGGRSHGAHALSHSAWQLSFCHFWQYHTPGSMRSATMGASREFLKVDLCDAARACMVCICRGDCSSESIRMRRLHMLYSMERLCVRSCPKSLSMWAPVYVKHTSMNSSRVPSTTTLELARPCTRVELHKFPRDTRARTRTCTSRILRRPTTR